MELIQVETIKIKKGKMGAAKIVIFLSCLMFANICFGQQAFTGTFFRSDQPDSAIYYNFSHNNFNIFTYTHSYKRIDARGSYSIVGDTLYLNYKPLTKKHASQWKFVEKNAFNFLIGKDDSVSKELASTQVQFQVTHSNGKPLQGINLVLLNKKGQAVTGFVSDTLGYFPVMLFFDDYIKRFRFAFVGYKTLTIEAKKMIGYRSKIQVILSNFYHSYNDFGGTKSYLIKKLNKNKMVLESLENHQKIVLERED